MKNILILVGAILLTIAIPYMCVATAWLCTFGAFDYQATVTSDGFYVAYTLYWTMAWLLVYGIYEKYSV
jgi:hypothetical protein